MKPRFLAAVCCCFAASLSLAGGSDGELEAYYTRVVSDQPFERYSRTGDHADIVVEVAEGRLCFWRGSSYLPYWENGSGRWLLDEIVPRRGDGDERRPDRVNTFSRVHLIESEANRAVVLWRYLPEFSGAQPAEGVDATGFVEELFTVAPSGRVTRVIRQGGPKVDAWRDPKNRITQTLQLHANGVTELGLSRASRSDTPSRGVALTERAGNADPPGEPVLHFAFDEGRGEKTSDRISGEKVDIAGHKAMWRSGVSGAALQFDGYHTEVRMPAGQTPRPRDALALEAWVAVAAYPWNWTPLVQQVDGVPQQVVAMTGDEALLKSQEEGGEEEARLASEEEPDLDEESDAQFDESANLDFEGDTSLMVSDHEAFDLTESSYTIVAKVRTEEGGTIFAQAPADGEYSENSKSLFIAEGLVQFDIGWVGVMESDVEVDDGRWHWVALVFDADEGEASLFVDGDELAVESMEPTGAVTEDHILRIGFTASDFPDEVRGFEGEMPEVAFYQRKLGPAELTAFAGGDAPSEGLVAHWNRFDHDADKFLDAVGQRHAELEEVEVAPIEEEEDDFDDDEEEDDDFAFRITPEDDRGYFLGIDGLGRPGFMLRVAGEWQSLVAETVVPRRQWKHVAGTYDGHSGNMVLYVDGQRVAELSTPGGPIELSEEAVVVGRGKPRRPSRPVRRNTFVDTYSFDGVIDEVRVHDRALSAEEVSDSFAALRPNPSSDSPLAARGLPEGPEGSGRFAAHYEHLKFYEAWDNLWRFGDHPDVVVTFDKLPAKFVFWRGCGYIPMIVNDQGQWYSNEFNETWDTSGGQGCQEPMSDKESYTNHARIIENTPARVVVHWRYPLLDVLHVAANHDPQTGWSDWADWYYTIYPDGVAVKRMRLWTDGDRNHEWQESMAILGPEQHPEEVLETAPALRLIDLAGNVTKYNWVHGPPDDIDVEGKCVQVVNYKSDYDPFTIGAFTGGDVYGGELTEYAVFPTWNHWPVAQMPSDGRYATYADRTSHSSLTHVFLPTHRESFGDRPYEERLMLEGLSDGDDRELAALARSWMAPPALRVLSGASSEGYDPSRRAYRLVATGGPIVLELDASEASPAFNPAFAVNGWTGGDARVTAEQAELTDVRVGAPRTVRDVDLVVWTEMQATSTVRLSIQPTE